MDIKQALDKIEEEYFSASGAWTGCDWPTGEDYIEELDGMSGDEAEERGDNDPENEEAWAKAAKFLWGVEEDAALAEETAREAINAVRDGNMVMALELAQKVVSIEMEYADCPTWGPFRNAVRIWTELVNPD